MSNFNTISNLHGYLALFVPKTPSVVWYFIIDLIPSNFHSYLALFESKSAVIFICFYHLIVKFTNSGLSFSLFSFLFLFLFLIYFLLFLFLEHKVRVSDGHES